jgi:hypothetical protein
MRLEPSDMEEKGRREEADFLYSEAADVLDRMDVVAADLGDDPDIEKSDQLRKAVKAAELAREKLEHGNETPSDEVLEDVRELIKTAQMHANEAEPAFPRRQDDDEDYEEDDDDVR